jgi:rhamnosyl/mannosyltransferase
MENFLGDLLPALNKQGVETMALVHRSTGRDGEVDSCAEESMIVRAPCYGSLLYAPVSPTFPLLFNNLLKKFKPDIIHLHVPNTSAFWVMILSRAFKIPWVIHWHADVVASNIDKRLAIAYSAYRPFEQRLLAKAETVIATSARYLESSIPLNSWHEKSQVIPLGLDPERLGLPEQKTVQKMELLWENKKKSFRVLAIGRLTYYKGHDVLIRALAKTENIQLVIVGEGEQRQELERLVAELKLQEKVVLSGLLSEADLQALLVSCDCCCLPSIERTEAFGLVLLEAMRYGKAIIAADVPGSGMGWVVQDEVTGLLFPVGDVAALAGLMSCLSEEPEKNSALGMAGKLRFDESFHIDRIAEKTRELYQQISGEHYFF